MDTYNGWSNRETWLVNLHFQFESRAELEFVRETLMDQLSDMPFFWQDFIDLSKIDWEELASYLPEEENHEE